MTVDKACLFLLVFCVCRVLAFGLCQEEEPATPAEEIAADAARKAAVDMGASPTEAGKAAEKAKKEQAAKQHDLVHAV